MVTYRITVKTWDRHFGAGHVAYSKKLEVARRSKKHDESAVALLVIGMALHKPEGENAEAWAEVSVPRFGPTTLEAYVGDSRYGGKWVKR